MWNRRFWDRFLLAIFKSIKKDTRNTKKFLSILPNIPMTPFHNKKIITFIIILKRILTNLKTLPTILIVILKSISSHKNHLKKTSKIFTYTPKHCYEPHSYWKLITLKSRWKKYAYKSENILLSPFHTNNSRKNHLKKTSSKHYYENKYFL